MTRSLYVHLIAAAAATLAGCASGSGLNRPATPLNPAAPGSGGSGAGAALPALSAVRLSDGTVKAAGVGDPSGVQVSFAPSSDPDGGTLTLTLSGQSAAIDRAQAQTLALPGGALAAGVVQVGGWTAHEAAFNFGGRAGRTRALLVDGSVAGGPVAAALSIPADFQSFGGAPSIPTQGTAVFDTHMIGVYFPDQQAFPGDPERVLMAGRDQDFQASFGTGAVTGSFDPSFFDAAGNPITIAGGDFSIGVDASVQGDGFVGTALASGGGVQMDGPVAGLFLGDPGQRPNGVAGVFAVDGVGAAAAAFEGACTCFAGGN